MQEQDEENPVFQSAIQCSFHQHYTDSFATWTYTQGCKYTNESAIFQLALQIGKHPLPSTMLFLAPYSDLTRRNIHTPRYREGLQCMHLFILSYCETRAPKLPVVPQLSSYLMDCEQGDTALPFFPYTPII